MLQLEASWYCLKRKEAIVIFEHLEMAANKRQRRVNCSGHNTVVNWPIITYIKNSNFKWEYLKE